MEKIKVSMILFYDSKGNILLQNRKEISKRGEEYGFFGGHMEKEETPEEALKREIKEELNFDIENFSFFKRDQHLLPEINLDVTRWVYLAQMPDIKDLTVSEGKPAFMKFVDSFNIKMVPRDIELLKEIYEYLNKNK